MKNFLLNPQQTTAGLTPTSSLQRGVAQGWQQQIGSGPGSLADFFKTASNQAQMQGQIQNQMIGQSGPRFASATGQLQSQAALQRATDFDMFSANLANMFGQQQTAALQGAGQFGLGQQQMQMQPLLQLLQGALFGGGVTQDPAFVQNPGTFGQIMGLALPAAGMLLGGPGGAAVGGAIAGKGKG